MKKLLSLLLTLALATSAFAECAFYMDDFVVNRDQIGNETEITLPIKATFSGRLNGWDLLIEYPEHLIPTFIEPGADMTLTYYNARGRQQTLNAPLSGANEPWEHLLCAIATEGFYQDPEGEDPEAWVSYIAVKWEPGVYEEMLLLSFIVEEGFEGGDIVFKTCCASGRDPRGGTIQNLPGWTRLCGPSHGPALFARQRWSLTRRNQSYGTFMSCDGGRIVTCDGGGCSKYGEESLFRER